MYKVVAVDLDGTLLNREHLISEKSKKVIGRLTEQKVKFILASGRPFRSMLPYAEELRIKLPLITVNGARVKAIDNEKYCQTSFIPWKLAEQVIDYGRKHQGCLTIYGVEETYTFDQASAQRQLELEKIRLKVVEKLTSETKVLKIIFYALPEVDRKMAQSMRRLFGDQLYITQSDGIYLEVMNQGVSKGNALQRLLSDLEISRDEVVAFGNGLNDLSMFSVAAFSVAMANSPDEVKKRADFITKSNVEDGVVYALEMLFE
jgi:Cof subfamily protein (haloacid dehalogenase superfamily)